GDHSGVGEDAVDGGVAGEQAAVAVEDATAVRLPRALLGVLRRRHRRQRRPLADLHVGEPDGEDGRHRRKGEEQPDPARAEVGLLGDEPTAGAAGRGAGRTPGHGEAASASVGPNSPLSRATSFWTGSCPGWVAPLPGAPGTVTCACEAVT